MDNNQRNSKNLVDINDLIGDAVNNAIARRNQADFFSALSDEEAISVAGGTRALVPIVVGLVVPPDSPSFS
ncbi:hypothetical protein G7B40_006780 [Aetokthonos hydrillicola Thurmond2011]|jgi:hypothetical protein|uniref:Uncharacterized protein n=1 Tax=Aetokthonos hydrillicola Thurmond2011 TaxID=2712845 RepID=A0AAP5M3X7_9CYAN|nr:hypothetical protein [Aetokthonos hydrillicola]MBO3458521.1 hypothetical protein [Aetokthonos hydrillicola CCALA 1050]MBW4584965.1 hypothetical protein [Aetokthonos hydrillicola CCALA 1050]MDR9894276.1 hypothetical protein [Aetokthonos hydrillicola Thurmond2011]